MLQRTWLAVQQHISNWFHTSHEICALQNVSWNLLHASKSLIQALLLLPWLRSGIVHNVLQGFCFDILWMLFGSCKDLKLQNGSFFVSFQNSMCEVLKINLFHLQVGPFRHFHFLPLPARNCLQDFLLYCFQILRFCSSSKDSRLSNFAPECVKAELQHPVWLFLDLPNPPDNVLQLQSAAVQQWRWQQFPNFLPERFENECKMHLPVINWWLSDKFWFCLIETFRQGLWLYVSVESCCVLLFNIGGQNTHVHDQSTNPTLL